VFEYPKDRHPDRSFPPLIVAKTSFDNPPGTVSATEADPVPGNNTDAETTMILAPVFSDDFETGDTTAWSNATP